MRTQLDRLIARVNVSRRLPLVAQAAALPAVVDDLLHLLAELVKEVERLKARADDGKS